MNRIIVSVLLGLLMTTQSAVAQGRTEREMELARQIQELMRDSFSGKVRVAGPVLLNRSGEGDYASVNVSIRLNPTPFDSNLEH